MNSEHITDRLDDYVDDNLTTEERALVESHLEGCESCSAALRAYEPVTLGDLRVPSDDDDGLRRAVRRAIGRTAIDAAALTVIVVVLGVLASLFVVQPLLINRADRAAVAARAAYEAPMLFGPGVSVSRFTIASGLFARTTTASASIQLGSSTHEFDPIESKIGLFSVDPEWAAPLSRSIVPASDVLPGLDPGTVITVGFDLVEPLSTSDAQGLAAEPGRDVRLTWAGFDVESSIFGRVGYPLCHTVPVPERSLFGASSASVGGTVVTGPPSIERALASAREALAVIVSNDEVAAAMSGAGAGPIQVIADSMNEDRSVISFVVTGPSPEVASFLDDLGVSNGQVLAVGLYSWGSPVCGR